MPICFCSRHYLIVFVTLSLTATFMSIQTISAESWSVTVDKMKSAREQWEVTCEKRGCYEQGKFPDPVEDAYGRAIGELLDAWITGQVKRRAGLTAKELRPGNDRQVRDVLNLSVGRWIGTTNWGTHISLGEIRGVITDFKVEFKNGQFTQTSIHPDLSCVSSGQFVSVQKGSLRFANRKQSGECRDVQIGIRLYDDGTLKWTRFVGNWPQAWATLRPVR